MEEINLKTFKEVFIMMTRVKIIVKATLEVIMTMAMVFICAFMLICALCFMSNGLTSAWCLLGLANTFAIGAIIYLVMEYKG